MKAHVWIGTVAATLLAGAWGLGAEPPSCQPALDGFLKRLAPAGGWKPYGDGLLKWWPQHCFPRCGAPDDYCRKPLPCVCWPPYPAYYQWGPPEVRHPQDGNCPRACNKPH